MIRNSTQNWTPGATVKVGFLTLRVVRAIPMAQRTALAARTHRRWHRALPWVWMSSSPCALRAQSLPRPLGGEHQRLALAPALFRQATSPRPATGLVRRQAQPLRPRHNRFR